MMNNRGPSRLAARGVGRKLGESSQAALKHAVHQLAREDHIPVGKGVANLAAAPLGFDETSRPEDPEMLRCVWLADADAGGEAGDLERTLGQPMEDLQPDRTRENPEDLCLEPGDLVHASSMLVCAVAHECRVSCSRGLVSATGGPLVPTPVEARGETG